MVDLKEWRPFQRMMHEVFRDLGHIHHHHHLRDGIDFVPPLEIRDSDKEFRIRADIPGISRKDIDITLDDHVLIIHGQRETPGNEDVALSEIPVGAFERRIHLPKTADYGKLRAEYIDGVLIVSVPKKKEEVKKKRKIEVQ